MLKEKTLYSYQSEGFRLQLVSLDDVSGLYYQVRLNRVRDLTTNNLAESKKRFRALIFQNLYTQSLF